MGGGDTWFGCSPYRVISVLLHKVACVLVEFFSMAESAYWAEMDQVSIDALVENIPFVGRGPAGFMGQASTVPSSGIVRGYSVLEYDKHNDEGDSEDRYAEVHFFLRVLPDSEGYRQRR